MTQKAFSPGILPPSVKVSLLSFMVLSWCLSSASRRGDGMGAAVGRSIADRAPVRKRGFGPRAAWRRRNGRVPWAGLSRDEAGTVHEGAQVPSRAARRPVPGSSASMPSDALFAGAAPCIAAVGRPARLALDPPSLLAERQPAYGRGTVLQAPLAAVGCALCLAAWWQTAMRGGRSAPA
jgi:hypothetical protein